MRGRSSKRLGTHRQPIGAPHLLGFGPTVLSITQARFCLHTIMREGSYKELARNTVRTVSEAFPDKTA